MKVSTPFSFPKLISLSLFLSMMVGSASAADVCPFDNKSKPIKEVPFQQLYTWVSSIPKEKGQFEKTLDFDREVQLALSHVTETLKARTGFDGIVVRKNIVTARYDADHETVSIKTEERYFSPIYDSSFLDSFSGVETRGIDTGLYTAELGQYDAQNAFGAHKLVTKQLRYEDFIAFGKGGYRAVPHFGSSIRIHLPAEAARQAMAHLEIAVAGKLFFPSLIGLKSIPRPKWTCPTMYRASRK